MPRGCPADPMFAPSWQPDGLFVRTASKHFLLYVVASNVRVPVSSHVQGTWTLECLPIGASLLGLSFDGS